VGPVRQYFWAPAAFTFAVMHWGDTGWLAIAGFVIAASFGLHPSARAAERFAASQFKLPANATGEPIDRLST
jgi:hypothetical protein